MTTKMVLYNLDEVRRFVDLANDCSFPIVLETDTYKADSKSIMSVLSLDLSHPLTASVDDKDAEAFHKELKKHALENVLL